MIATKIKFTPEFAKSNADFYADASVDVLNTVTPENLWRNLINISIWPRLDSRIVDARFEDNFLSDPHLADKVQFILTFSTGEVVRANVIYCVGPKDDRTGKLAFEATAYPSANDPRTASPQGKETSELYSFVAEFVVGVPDTDGNFDFMGAVSDKTAHPNDRISSKLSEELIADLEAMAEYSRRHH